ncbi:MAG TPA: hypothetical protein VKV29_10250 [Chthonomonas sp.]|nr:hypothetical protein [Chthonomonas sp.]
MSSNVSEKNTPSTAPEAASAAAQNEMPKPMRQAARTLEGAPQFVAPTRGNMDILKLLSELEDMVDHARRGPMGILLGFPEERFHITLMKIRANLPEEVKRAANLAQQREQLLEEARQQAERIRQEAKESALAEQERRQNELAQMRLKMQQELEEERKRLEKEALKILDQAREQAHQILREAEARAAHLITESVIYKEAEKRAQALRLEAENDAAATRHGADEYAKTVLNNMEEVLQRALLQVQKGKELLSNSK